MKERSLQFIKSLLSRKKAFFGVALLVVLFSSVPLEFARANIFSDIFGLISNLWLGWAFGIPLAIITALLVIGALLAAWLAAALVVIIKFFIVSSLSVPILPNSGIDVVTQGWQFSVGLVNIVLILILVFIGLATILRLQNYQMQRTLPLLVVVALLVNFSGVFVAFIVDIANLVTNVFVAKLGGFNMAVEGSKAILESLAKGLVGIVTNLTDFGAILVPPVTAALYLLFYLVFSAVMFIVALLIIVRVGILWALTILAPLAFASYILPATRGLWNQWLKQLIQWSIIGIPIAFFLWLAQVAAGAGTSIKSAFMVGVNKDCYNPLSDQFFNTTECLAGADPGLVAVIANLIGPAIALLFVVIGIMVAMQFAPAGANQVINFGKKWGLRGGAALGTFAWRRTGAGIEKFGANIRKRAQGTWDVEKDALTGGEKALGAFAKGTGLTFLGRQLGKAPGVSRFGKRSAEILGTAIEYGSSKVSTQMHKRDDAEMASGEKAGTNQSPLDNANELNEAARKGDWNAYVGRLVATLEKNGDSDEIRKMADSGRISWKNIDTALQHAERHGNPAFYRPIIKAFLDKMQDGEKDEDGTLLHPQKSHYDAIWEKLATGNIRSKLVDLQSIRGTEAGNAVLEDLFLKADTNMTTEALRHPNREVRDWVVQQAESLGAEWFLENGRQDTLEAIVSSGGRSMGVPVFGGLTRDGIRRMAAERTGHLNDEQLEQKIRETDKRIDGLKIREAEERARTGKQGAVRGVTTRIQELERERVENQEAQRLRQLSPQELETERTDIQSQISDLDEQLAASAINEPEYYRQTAQPRRTLERVEVELQRRGAAQPAEEQPLSLRLAELREREEQLKKDASRRVGPVRIGGTPGVAGERIGEELKKVQAQRRELEKWAAQMPEGTLLVEEQIRQTEQGMRREQQFIDSIQNTVNGLKQREQTMEENLQHLRQEQTNDPNLVPQELVAEREQHLQETENQRTAFEQELQEHQTKASAHQNRREVLTAGWKVLSKAEQPIKGVEELIEENVGKAEGQEKAAQQRVEQLRRQGAAPSVVAKAQAEVQQATEAKGAWENDLGRIQRLKELKETLAEAQSKQQQREAALEQLKENIQNAEEEIKGMTTEKTQAQQELETLGQRLASQRERITQELLAENPSLGTSARQFRKAMEEKLAVWQQQEPVQERSSQVGGLQEQQQSLQQEIEQRQKRVQELQEDKEALSRGLRRSRRRGETRDLNQQIAQERSALYVQQTRHEKNQRRLEQLNNELRNMREKARADIFWSDPEIQNIRATAKETRVNVEAAPSVSELHQNIQEREQYIREAEKEVARREKQRKGREKRAQKAQRAAEKAEQGVSEVEKEQEEVKEGQKKVKPKRSKK